jgi:hypothetical protein
MKRSLLLITLLISLAFTVSCEIGKTVNLPAPKSIYSPSATDNPLIGSYQVYRTEKLPTAEEKIPGLYFLSGKMIGSERGGQRAFIYFYVGKDEVVVFDAGQRHYGYDGNDIAKAIKKVSSKPVGAIYLTHRHFDHTTNAISLQKALTNHPPIYIGEPDYDFLFRLWTRHFGVSEDYFKEHIKSLPINPEAKNTEGYNPAYAGSLREGWAYYPACCHSAGNLVYFHKGLGVIIVGNWYQGGRREKDKSIKHLMEKEGITTTLFSHPNSIGQVSEDKDQSFDKKYYESKEDTKGLQKDENKY